MKRIDHGGLRGFTIIELMIAIALIGAMMALVSGSYIASVRAKKRMESRMELIAMGRIALDKMIKEIEGAVLDPNNLTSTPFLGEPGGSSSNPQDELTFFTSTFDPRQLRAGGNMAEISYYLRKNEEIDGSFFLMRRADPFPDLTPKEGGIIFDIAEQVSGLRFRYQDENEVWNSRWDATTTGALPRLVEITLHLKGVNGGMIQLRGVAAPMSWEPPKTTF